MPNVCTWGTVVDVRTVDDVRTNPDPTLCAVKCGVEATVVCGSLSVVLVVNVITEYVCDRSCGMFVGDRALTGALLDGLHGAFDGSALLPFAIRVGGDRSTACGSLSSVPVCVRTDVLAVEP